MRIVGICGGYACLGLSFLIFFEIIARKLFNYSLQGVDEVGGYVVAIIGTFGMALAAVERAHTRIDVLLFRLPKKGSSYSKPYFIHSVRDWRCFYGVYGMVYS